MIITINKTVGNIDFGVSGKKTLSLELKLELKKGKWEFFCYYAYIVKSNGNKVPVGQDMLTHKFLKEQIDKAIEDMGSIKDYETSTVIK